VIHNSQYIQKFGHYGLVYGSKNKTTPECTPGLQLPQGYFTVSHKTESGTTKYDYLIPEDQSFWIPVQDKMPQ